MAKNRYDTLIALPFQPPVSLPGIPNQLLPSTYSGVLLTINGHQIPNGETFENVASPGEKVHVDVQLLVLGQLYQTLPIETDNITIDIQANGLPGNYRNAPDAASAFGHETYKFTVGLGDPAEISFDMIVPVSGTYSINVDVTSSNATAVPGFVNNITSYFTTSKVSSTINTTSIPSRIPIGATINTSVSVSSNKPVEGGRVFVTMRRSGSSSYQSTVSNTYQMRDTSVFGSGNLDVCPDNGKRADGTSCSACTADPHLSSVVVNYLITTNGQLSAAIPPTVYGNIIANVVPTYVDLSLHYEGNQIQKYHGIENTRPPQSAPGIQCGSIEDCTTCFNFQNVNTPADFQQQQILIDTIYTYLHATASASQIKPYQSYSVQMNLQQEDVQNFQNGVPVAFANQTLNLTLVGSLKNNSASFLSLPTDGSGNTITGVTPRVLQPGTLPNYPPNYPLKPDTYNVVLQYNPDSTHKPVSVSSQLVVDKINTALTNVTAPQSLFVLSSGSISGTLMDTDQNQPIQNAPIQVYIDGVQVGPIYTDAKGVFTLDVTGKSLGGAGDGSKNHNVSIQFLEDTYYLGSSTSKTITVSKSQPTIHISPGVTISTLGSTDVVGALTDVNAVSLTGLPIQLTVDGVSAGTLSVDSSGGFKLVVQGSTLSVGNHSISAAFVGDANRFPASRSTTITVRQATSVISWASGQSQSVYVEQDINYNGTLSVEGHPLPGATVVIAIGNKQTQLTTGADGSFVFVAHFVDSPSPIVYTMQASFAGTADGRIAGSTSSLNVTAARAPPVEYRTTLTANYDNKTDVLVATLASPQFGTCFQNVPLEVKVDGENPQTVPTDQQGNISIKLGLIPGEHTITVTFQGTHTDKYICDHATQSLHVNVLVYETLGRLVPVPYLAGGIVLLIIGVAAYSLLSKAAQPSPAVSFWSRGGS